MALAKIKRWTRFLVCLHTKLSNLFYVLFNFTPSFYSPLTQPKQNLRLNLQVSLGYYLRGRKVLSVFIWAEVHCDHKPLLAIFGRRKSSSAMVANGLGRWVLFHNQFDFDVDYRKTTLHQNADALSRLPQGEDEHFDKESLSDADVVCAINTFPSQMQVPDSAALQGETAKDPVLTKVLRFTREGWPHETDDAKLEKFRKLADSSTSLHGCLPYGTRVVIPLSLQPQELKVMHEDHFSIQRMKQLARTAFESLQVWHLLCRTSKSSSQITNSPMDGTRETKVSSSFGRCS